MRTLTLQREYSTDMTTILNGLGQVSSWEAMGSRAQVRRIDADVEVTVRTPISVGDLPAALASRLPQGAELVEIYVIPEDIIGDSTEIRMTASAKGVPVEIDALITLAKASAGSRLSVRAEISSSVPVFGSMIESAVVPILERKLGERLEKFSQL